MLNNLEKAGLFKKQESKSNWLTIKRALQLVVEDTDTANSPQIQIRLWEFKFWSPVRGFFNMHLVLDRNSGIHWIYLPLRHYVHFGSLTYLNLRHQLIIFLKELPQRYINLAQHLSTFTSNQSLHFLGNLIWNIQSWSPRVMTSFDKLQTTITKESELEKKN